VPKVYRVTSGNERARTPAEDISDATMRLRELGLVPWWWILDESRDVTTWRYAASVYDYVVETVPLARIDCWRGHLPPLVICEARATRGVLERIAGDYLCPITATGGQSGGFIVNEIVPLLADNDRKVLYIGDCEERGPGDHIEANTRRYIEEHTGASSRPRRGLRSRSHLRRSRAHDGFRMMVRRDGAGVRLLTRNCLISCTQPGPEGGRWARDGRQGSMNPAGRAARVCTNMVETDRAPTPGSRTPHDWGSHLVRPPPEKRISGLPNRRRSTLLAFGSLHLASPSNETLTSQGAACRNVLRPHLRSGRYRRRQILRAPHHQGRTHQWATRRQRPLAHRARRIIQDFPATATNATGNARRASPLATASFNNCCSALRAARWPICGRTATAGLPRPQTGSVVASNRVLLVGTSRIVVGVFADANAPVNEGRGAP